MMGGSPANSKISPEEMLRRHVDRILHRSAVPADQQGDLLEELCGHLWQRWRAEMESGLDADGAALAAIQSFGGPDELAVDMTRAFHGRLFATTIGVLLPAVVPPEGRPKGFTRSRALIGIVVAMWLALAPFQIWDGQWSLFQGFAGGLLAVFTLVMMVLAYQALGRQQWWALLFVRLLAIGVVVDGVVSFVGRPITINFLAVLGLAVLPAAFGQQMRDWVQGSRKVGVGLAVVILVGATGPWFAQPVVAAIPDPTVAGPSDLTMDVHVTCQGAPTNGAQAQGSVEIDLRWSRTDLLPYGPLGFWKGMTDTDQISLPVESGLAVDNGSVVDTSSGRSIASSEMRLSGNPYFQQAGNWISIDPANMAPGHLYRASFHFWASPVYANGDTYVRLRVTYDHQRRWGLEALVSCDQTVTASPALRDSATSIDFAQ